MWLVALDNLGELMSVDLQNSPDDYEILWRFRTAVDSRRLARAIKCEGDRAGAAIIALLAVDSVGL